ncbi:polyamine ABC transporter substrate-binding protein [Methyloligella sp. 2.7D]|uniref:polyamine ABC transporter substrate-binding protein n=1 Tax=unclassified Methyloligella TaxID=2625955 RepID=UPI00157D4CF9|nr:polyamine ABC transporter substrate-binding protein [Methyloligella sp. GL2]QKP78540.1 polyamine ABC transporter substrate-binding protein [Methyloligella sp. GL2]
MFERLLDTMLVRRAAGALIALAMVGTAAPLPAAAEDNVVTVSAWAEYIPQEVIDGFENKTGIKVIYNPFDTLETLETKMLTGDSGYDVIFPSAFMADRLIKIGALSPLDQDKLPNSGNLDPKIMALLARHDKGNRYGVPYLWGTTGIMYNPALIEERMKDAPVDSLAMIFDPKIVSKFADCGVAIIDSPEEIVSIALNYLGLDPYSTDPEDFKKVDALFAKIRPYITNFNTAAMINDMAQGNLCLALGWSGDAGLAYARAEEAGNGVEVYYSIPKQGTDIFFDFLSIPADAPDPDNAYAFLNYLMEPEVIATVTNSYFYPNGNAASLDYVDEAVKSDPNVYPPEDLMAKLFPNLPRDPKTLRMTTRTWSRFKTGN